MVLVNSGAWWNSTSGTYYNNSTDATNINFTNTGLSKKAKELISKSRYYLGAINDNNILTTKTYTYERMVTREGGIKSRYNDNNSLFWDGYVGLIYPSDHGYASGKSCYEGSVLSTYNGGCAAKGWTNSISLWMLTAAIDTSKNTTILTSGSLTYIESKTTRSVRPVFYLKPEVTITGGTGTAEDPYTVE